ncbi:MAG: universal stress protein [Pseudomonadales bacterium]
MAYSNIAVCLDLRSREADRLLHRAAALLDGGGAMSALTVIEIGSFDADREAVASLIEEEFWSRSAHLTRTCKEAGHPAVDTRVLVGGAADQISAFVEQHGCDLVVLGNHSDTRPRPRLGSTSDAVVQRVSCDALVVDVLALGP